MKQCEFRVTCDVCGGEGVGDVATAAAAWDASRTVRHTDPSECAANLRAERRKLEALRKSLEGGERRSEEEQ